MFFNKQVYPPLLHLHYQISVMRYSKTFAAIFLLMAGSTMLINTDANGQYYSISKQDSLVKVLIKRHIALCQAKKTIPGYRIQLYFGPDRNEAMKVKEDFEKTNKELTAHLSYQQPNFKIRVGDYTSRLEALRSLKDIHYIFSSAFLVKDDVNLPVY